MSGWERQVQALLGQDRTHWAVEHEREMLCRSLPCPICDAPRRGKCTFDAPKGMKISGRYSHTGRYNLAAAAGLVPELGGAR